MVRESLFTPKLITMTKASGRKMLTSASPVGWIVTPVGVATW